MTRQSQGRDEAADSALSRYLDATKRPAHILVFLLPLLIAYELSMVFVLRSDGGFTQTNKAHKTLISLFDAIGIEMTGWYLPGVAVLAVLVVWQVLSKDRWRIRWSNITGMVIESALLAIPLVVLGQLIARVALPATNGVGVEGLGPGSVVLLGPNGFVDMPMLDRIAMSIGAGIYEELLFRMAILGLLHGLMADVLKLRSSASTVVAIGVSAVLFALYHFDFAAFEASFTWPRMVFYTSAGVYFGFIFLFRGFGIVVGSHAVYDVVVALVT